MVLFEQLSETGKFHKSRNEDNQDAVCRIQTDRFFGVAAADGVSCRKHAKTGAELTCRMVKRRLEEKAEELFLYKPQQIAGDILNYILFALDKKAAADKIPVEEYASTVALALYDSATGKLLTMNLGDGIILGRQNEECKVLAYPSCDQDGACAVTTTRNCAKDAKTQILEASGIDLIVICTDGAWSIHGKAGIDPFVNSMVSIGNIEGLKTYLLNRESNEDDYSFAAMQISRNRRPA